jgi:hypothetical protein
LRLWDDAADYDYTNDAVQTPLYDAYSSIYNIVTGHLAHPIMTLFHAHMVQEISKHLGENNTNPTPRDLLHAASCFPFNVPVLPGDASLAVDFIASIKVHAGEEQPIDGCVLECVGQSLFNLVILRTYLGHPPENDMDIFEAVKNGLISRIWTSHEQALAACYGENNTSVDAPFDSVPHPELWGV